MDNESSQPVPQVKVTSPEPEPRSKRGPARILLLSAFQVGCVAYVAHVLWAQRAELAQALHLGWGGLTALGVLFFVAHLQRTYEFTLMLRRLGVHEPFWDGFMLTGAGFLLNHLPLNAGFVMRAAVLKRDHALPYASFLSLSMVNAVVNLAVAAALGLLSVALATPFRPERDLPLSGAFLAMLFGAALLMWLPTRAIPKGDSFIAKRLRAFASGVALVRGNRFGFVPLLALAISKVVIAAFRMAVCFAAMGAHVSPLAAALLASMTIVFTLFNVTPGNLGLRELALALVATQLGASYAVGMAAASVDRVVLLMYTVLTGLPGVYALRRRARLQPSAAR
jgi:uncharacterized protein (TIRG00374 family)